VLLQFLRVELRNPMIFLLRIVAIMAGGVFLLNGVPMLVSPARWFRMPAWLRLQGVMRRDQHSRGAGALEVRILGAAIVGAIAWVIYDLCRRSL